MSVGPCILKMKKCFGSHAFGNLPSQSALSILFADCLLNLGLNYPLKDPQIGLLNCCLNLDRLYCEQNEWLLKYQSI